MPATAFDISQPYLGLIRKHRPKPDETDMETQRKIAKGNAVAEAFRLLVDAVGGSKGANIGKREAPANAVMGAVDKYYKAKEANKAEQSRWDQAELGAGLKALETESQHRYDTEKQKRQQEFTVGQREKGQEFTAGERIAAEDFRKEESRLERESREGYQGAQATRQGEQFGKTLEQRKAEKKADIAFKYAQIDAQNLRSAQLHPYGADVKGIFISDADIQKQIRIPDNKQAQVLAYIKADPNIKDTITDVILSYGNLPPKTTTEFIIADYYSTLTPGTRAKIREFINEEQAPAQAEPVSPLLPPYPYQQGKGPLMAPQTPTIKTDKKSTMVQVEQPARAQGLTPEELSYIVKIAEGKKTPQQKAEEAYQYALKQGYDEESATTIGENLFKALTAN